MKYLYKLYSMKNIKMKTEKVFKKNQSRLKSNLKKMENLFLLTQTSSSYHTRILGCFIIIILFYSFCQVNKFLTTLEVDLWSFVT